MLRLQKCLYLNIFLDFTWVIVVSFFLYEKLDLLRNLTKYLTVTVFALLIVIEFVRIYLGYYGNLSCRVPELAGFLMLTSLMQLPLISYFLFNPHLMSTPTEITLHAMMSIISIVELLQGYFELRNSSAMTKRMYLTQIKNK